MSQNEVDYAKFILYYSKDNPASDGLLKTCAPFTSEFILQDVNLLKKPYPTWLKGTPTVVTLPNYTVHRGTQAIKAVREWCENQVNGIQGRNIGMSHAQSAQLEQVQSGEMPLLEMDTRYSDGASNKRSQEGVGAAGEPPSLEEMMRLRSKATSTRPVQM